MGAAYTCPECKKNCSCDCQSCYPNPTYGDYIIKDEGPNPEFLTCPYCLVRSHYDKWEEEDWNQIDIAMSKMREDEQINQGKTNP